ncbi:MAG: shikimate dehydrogenase [Henriciella sp.]|nr:shikimate dehydrogenase [Henriciella sp.]
MTKLLGVIGDPIAHSLSPLIHNGWIRDMGYDAAYEAMHVPDGEFSQALETLSKRDILGVNVTLPHKAAAFLAAYEASEAAKTIGAANTLTYLGNRSWRADNTDAPGFLSALDRQNPDTDEVVILGAGGSAAAIVYALTKSSYQVTILNRTVEKAQALAAALGDSSTVYGSINQYRECIDSAALVINTTSMGYQGDILDLPAGDGRLFFDISYGKVAAPQLTHARDRGWQTKDGLSMLVAQAAVSFEIWFGEAPDRAAALERCQWAMKAVS